MDENYQLYQKARNRIDPDIKFRAHKGVFTRGFHFAILSAVVITVYESIQYSSVEFNPDTRIASLMTFLIAFVAGAIDQFQADRAFNKQLEAEVRMLRRESGDVD